jgi:hypothetical protein
MSLRSSGSITVSATVDVAKEGKDKSLWGEFVEGPSD